ncbi:TetR/AcrR family transcriptional regulator [Planomonospora venezuelensis]|uniref:AcrR family transcriptional regulator n=1 Tax=Planomonospora venezuelensis TaxID=1999 RepID=A0A841D8X0_PLAVE|nr:TetR/AcrR family transcriptional regulator [Planomonospora venezuelensis]MBB5965313.1 AcrR family transcriptional regulator [Planomonospora venezuelensis]GIN00446.1 TetR family transcriptional regulator [Planomonospora venezuelensis]
MGTPTGRPLRADAERSIKAIMKAAEDLLGANPAATMEQIAEAAGVARATVHRRFASREALIEAMEVAAWRELEQAVEAARPHTAPPLVALHQATANILQIKPGWRFTLARPVPLSPQAQAVHAGVMAACETVFARAKESGLLGPDADTTWARQAYLALLSEAAHGAARDSGPGPDALATRVIDTLMHGIAAPPADRDRRRA